MRLSPLSGDIYRYLGIQEQLSCSPVRPGEGNVMSGPRPLAEGDPQRIGDYRLTGVLGAGGQGVVYLGQAPSGRSVAVKTLHARMTSDAPAQKRFLRETEITRHVAAFCTARVIDAGIAGGRPYLVSEYVQGPSLEELVAQDGPRTGGGLDRLAITTLIALDAIHRAGIVHRDFKPSNVIMGQEGPVVIDFGIARMLEGSSTQSGLTGTPAYLSPEQLNGDPAGVASDLFAWAATIVYAATGHRAFPGAAAAVVLNAIMTREPDLTGVPDHLRPLLAATLAKDPASRPGITDLFTALTHETPLEDPRGRRLEPPHDHAPAAEPSRPLKRMAVPEKVTPVTDDPGRSVAAPTPASPQTPLPARAPLRRLVTVLATVAAVIMIPAAWWLRPVVTDAFSGTARPTAATTSPSPAPFGTLIREPLEGRQTWVLSVAVAQLDGRPVIVSGGYDGTVQVSDLATGTPVGEPFKGHRGSVWSVATGELNGRPVVVSGSRDGTVRVWDMRSGEPIGHPFKGHQASVESVAVGRLSGRPVVVSGSIDGTVRIWDMQSGEPIGEPVRDHQTWVLSVAVAQLDGRPVIVSGGYHGTVLISDLATGAPLAERPNAHHGPVESVTVGQLNGRPVAISGGGKGDHTVRVWDVATGEPIGKPFKGHQSWALGLATGQLSDGRPVVISGGYNDQTVRVWDLATGEPIGKPFKGHRGLIESVAIGQLDGRPVAVSAGNDGKVRVWSLGPPYPSPGP
ncbi:protein kinase [Nonomuraea sp. NPDC049158]|uniref:protein kinase domain-containing protein n=1 Tax=Nonomuraea sp. NPDC049158 TaxID=3155649 RepID=UPI0033F5B8C6